MKFSIPADRSLPLGVPAEVGNVYRCKGGGGAANNKTQFYLVVGLTLNGVHCIGLNHEGEVVSTVSYSRHVFEGNQYSGGRTVLGVCPEVKEMEFDIQWFGKECCE